MAPKSKQTHKVIQKRGIFAELMRTKASDIAPADIKAMPTQCLDGASSPTPISPADSALGGSAFIPPGTSGSDDATSAKHHSNATPHLEGPKSPPGLVSVSLPHIDAIDLNTLRPVSPLCLDDRPQHPLIPALSPPWLALSRSLTARVMSLYIDKDLDLNHPFAHLSSRDIQTRIDSNNSTLSNVKAEIASIEAQMSALALKEAEDERIKDAREERNMIERVAKQCVTQVLTAAMKEILGVVGLHAGWHEELKGELRRYVRLYELKRDASERGELGVGLWSQNDVQDGVEEWFRHLEKVRAGVERAEAVGTNRSSKEVSLADGKPEVECDGGGEEDERQEQRDGRQAVSNSPGAVSMDLKHGADANAAVVKMLAMTRGKISRTREMSSSSQACHKVSRSWSTLAEIWTANGHNGERGHRASKSWS
ncbi:hypothetical protein KVT40_008657 [Elsinoe batatas]|uniref:Uncharacterized protein n=1 Tax=Elsinoe batatas TaxID=2601811 RepID=A0A8K0KTL0_9PEZI|nr:hypothetical protein KVT40_008657 [Elsinoe batatas]